MPARLSARSRLLVSVAIVYTSQYTHSSFGMSIKDWRQQSGLRLRMPGICDFRPFFETSNFVLLFGLGWPEVLLRMGATCCKDTDQALDDSACTWCLGKQSCNGMKLIGDSYQVDIPSEHHIRNQLDVYSSARYKPTIYFPED